MDESPIDDASLHNELTLRSAPSFDVYNSGEGYGDGDYDAEAVIQRTITTGQSAEVCGGDFSFRRKEAMDLIEEEGESEKEEVVSEIERPVSPPMYLAAGLGVVPFDDAFPDVVDELCLPDLDASGCGGDVEECYRRMVEEYPSHPLVLRNCAQILLSKGDLHGAEEYFLRATLADPNNGEILMQYAKLVWDLHRDKQRALEYFERAAQASPPDSQVLAAYASFLWEIEDDNDEEGGNHDSNSKNENNKQKIAGIEDYHRKKIDEDPSNPSFLESHDQFLIQSKGDLNGTGECLSREPLADPTYGKILMQYAQLQWELHQDKEKALSYFELAAQAAPLDSDILGAYASFLWEMEDDEEEGGKQQSNREEDQKQHAIIVKDDKIEDDAVNLDLANCGIDGSTEDYYKKMIDENPNNVYFLKNYTRFLIQSKKDLQAAEKYYSRAISINPDDGEMITEFAKLEWQLHHDRRKTLSYFEQAVEATPENSNVLAAYACFLWETEDVEAEISE